MEAIRQYYEAYANIQQLGKNFKAGNVPAGKRINKDSEEVQTLLKTIL